MENGITFKGLKKSKSSASNGVSSKFIALIKLLNLLDSRGRISLTTLMNELELSERTVYRYIKTLEEGGIPIYYDREKGCYSLVEGYSLKKPNMTIEESLALTLAKGMLKSTGTGMESELLSIEQKLTKKQATSTDFIVMAGKQQPIHGEKYLAAINQARMDLRKLKIRYSALYSGEETVRTVDPCYLFYEDGFWHLRAYCHLREEFRLFDLDRILELEVLNDHFMPKRISADEELAGAFGGYLDGEPEEVVLIFDAEIAPHILRKKWHQSQKVTDLPDGKIKVGFTVNGIDGIKPWIYRWIPNVTIVSPESLKQLFLSELMIAIKNNTGK